MFSDKGMMRFCIGITIWGFIMVTPLTVFILNWLWWTVSGSNILSAEFLTVDRVMSAVAQAIAGALCIWQGPQGYASARKRLADSVASKFK